jgi:DNA-binding response OmpR family regulator
MGGQATRPDGVDERSLSGSLASSGGLRDICVLIVDDDEDAREILRMCFEYMGAVPVTAESADEALFLFLRVRPHVVLTDIAMPDHDGDWLLRQVRALERTQPQRTPVIAMTAFSDIGPKVEPMRAGFDDWFGKPLDLLDLVAAVGRCLNGRRAA